MTSRRSSLSGSIDDVAISHVRTTSNTSVFSLATPLAFAQPATSHKSQGNRGSAFLQKLKHAKLGGHHSRETSEQWEWRCKGEDIENFDWPPEGWVRPTQPTDTPPLSPSGPRQDSLPIRHAARDSTGSTASTSSVASWPDEAIEAMPSGKAATRRLNLAEEAEQRRQDAERAAIEAIESFITVKRSSVLAPVAIPEDEDDFGIDLSAYDEDACPSTFLPASPMTTSPAPVLPSTPVIDLRPAPKNRASFLSCSDSDDDSVDSRKAITTFPVTVILPHHSRTRHIPPPQTSRSISVQSLPLPTSVHRRTPSPVPSDLVRRPLPALPKLIRARPSSMLVVPAREAIDSRVRAQRTASVAYSAEELVMLRSQGRATRYSWI